MTRPEDVLTFWLDEVGEKRWFESNPELDQEIRDRFLEAWTLGREGSFGLWLTYASGTLAYAILHDQLPRNMFRGDARAFATDTIARAAAKMAIGRDWDLRIDPPARQIFYMPLMHSESLSDQDRCVRLIKTRMGPDSGYLIHARAHREIIRRFGRFPFRNEALMRSTTRLEAEFIESGGYGAVLRKLQAAIQP